MIFTFIPYLSKNWLFSSVEFWEDVEEIWSTGSNPLVPPIWRLRTRQEEENWSTEWMVVWMLSCSVFWILCSQMYLWETRYADIRSTDHEGQECSGQQAGWAYHQSFKQGLMREGDVFLSDWEEPANTVTLGNIRGKPQICPREIWEDSLRKTTWPIAQLRCMQHEK